MVIWRGLGFLIALFFILGLMIPGSIAQTYWGDPLPVDVRRATELIGMLFAAALAFALHLWLRTSAKPRVVIDKESNQEFTLVPKHDLFFIPVRFWPGILVVLGVMFYYQ